MKRIQERGGKLRFILLLAVVALVSPIREIGAQGNARDSTIANFSRDLAQLQRVVDSLAYISYSRSAAAERANTVERRHPGTWPRDSDGLIDRLVALAARYAAKWKDDPYVVIEGFDLAMGFEPSLAVHFRFKEVPNQRPVTH